MHIYNKVYVLLTLCYMFWRLYHLQGEFYRRLNNIFVHTIKYVQRVSQELRSLIRDLILELMLSQKRHIHVGPIGNVVGVNEFLK